MTNFHSTITDQTFEEIKISKDLKMLINYTNVQAQAIIDFPKLVDTCLASD